MHKNVPSVATFRELCILNLVDAHCWILVAIKFGPISAALSSEAAGPKAVADIAAIGIRSLYAPMVITTVAKTPVI
jgi:hypothetical protein